MISTRLQEFAGSTRSLWAAFAGGTILVTAFAPFGLYWLAPLLLAGLALLWEHADRRQAARLGFFFGFGLFAAGTWWLYISLNIIGGLWPPLAILMMLLMVLALSSYVALAGYVLARWSTAGSRVRWLLMFPAVWTISEWLRGWVLTGFPWMSIGYGQAESPVGAFAPIGGVYGVTWVILLLAGSLTTLLLGKGRQRWVAVMLLAGIGSAAVILNDHEWTEVSQQDFRVRLVQGAIPQEQKWLPEQRQPTLDLYRRLSHSETPLDLIVWPEAAIPALPFEVQDFLQSVRDEMIARDTQLFTGMLSYEPRQNVFLNTLWAIGAEEGRYHKRHLVPFGEYFPVPDFVREVLRLMNLPSENITPGESVQLPLYAKGVPVAPTICYETAYGAEQLDFFPDAQLLVNVSNDAWFGDTIAPHQHLQINQFRARESGRYMLRATNTGITAVIDPFGRVIGRIPQFEPGAVDAVIEPRQGMTPYLRWGNWPVIAALLLLLAAIVRHSRYLKTLT